jgi:TPR repeat protein
MKFTRALVVVIGLLLADAYPLTVDTLSSEEIALSDKPLIEGKMASIDLPEGLGFSCESAIEEFKAPNVPQVRMEELGHEALACFYLNDAQNGDTDSAYRLAGLLFEGASGITKNPEAALKIDQAAADAGNTSAAIALAEAYRVGIDAPANLEMALYWYRRLLLTPKEAAHLQNMSQSACNEPAPTGILYDGFAKIP